MNDRARDEHELVRRCREGSEAAYAELVRHHRPRMHALAYRLTNDRETAEDIVQEAFLAAFKSIEKVDPNPSLAPWLNTVVLRIASRAVARRSARAGPSIDRMVDADPGSIGFVEFASFDAATDPHAAAEAAELGRALAEAIAALPFKYRAAVVLRFVMGLDYAEAALTLGLPINTFKSTLLRGTRMLRERLTRSLGAAPSLEPTVRGAPPAGGPVASDGQRPVARAAGTLRDPAAVGSERIAGG